jgi:hypothetical protein
MAACEWDGKQRYKIDDVLVELNSLLQSPGCAADAGHGIAHVTSVRVALKHSEARRDVTQFDLLSSTCECSGKWLHA